MNQFKFIIPLKLDDLTSFSNDTERYVVSRELTPREISNGLSGCLENLNRLGSDYILDDFDVFFCVLKNFPVLESKTKSQAWRCISKSATALLKHLSRLLDETEGALDVASERLKQCNCLKMIVYVFCSIIELFEEQDIKSSTNVDSNLMAKGRKKQNKRSDDSYDWEKDKERGVDVLLRIFTLSLNRLFTPPVVEDEFVNIVTKCCYKMIENPSVAKNKPLLANIFHILGNSVEKHRQSLSFCLKIIQLLQHKEMLANLLSQLVHTVVKDHNQKLLVSEIVREVGRIDIRDLSRDSSGPRAITQFLVDVADKCPEETLPSVAALIDYLEQESYMMRSATLSIMGILVSEVLSGDDMDSNRKHLRDQLLDKLEEHILDVTTFTRGRALQVWCRLCDENKIPLTRLESLIEAVVFRLLDKSCYVRKHAVQFLNSFLKKNPFAAKLPLLTLQEAFNKENEKLTTMVDMAKVAQEAKTQETGSDAGSDGEPETGETKSEVEEPMDLDNRKTAEDVERVAAVIISNSQQPNQPTTTITRASCSDNSVATETNKQQILVKYLGDCVKFAQQIKLAIPLVCSLLHSRNVSDVQEAIEFFVTAFEFGVQGALVGIRKMITLVFSPEKAVREAVVEAYKSVYLKSPNLEDKSTRGRGLAIVKSLTELVQGASLGELISLEELLKELMDTGDIETTHVTIMWERYAMKIAETTPEESRVAVQLIAMISSTNPEIIQSNIETLITVGLGPRGDSDSRLVQYTCSALRKVTEDKPKIETKVMPFRLAKNHKLFTRLSEILVRGLTDVDDEFWLPMSDEAIKVIFKLAEGPDYICEQLVKNMIKEIIKKSSETTESLSRQEKDKDEDEDEDKSQEGEDGDETLIENNSQAELFDSEGEKNESQPTAPTPTENFDFATNYLSAEILSRFINVVGNVALNEMIHLEINIFTELKMRNLIKEEKEDKRKSSFSKTTRNRRSTFSKTPGDANLEEEIGLAGAAAVEDVEQEYLATLCDDEIVRKYGQNENLLARLSALIITVASDPVRYNDARLRSAATLALAKYMAVSEKFCTEHLRLLFTILEKSTEPLLRQNTIISLGDLCVRYPNLLDLWTPKLYIPLRDADVAVRTNTLKVLSRLILSDMVKVKGQISEMAKIIVDDEIALSANARLFFAELGKKQNAIYNVLPDIISNLSDVEVGIDEEKFRAVTKFLFDLIEKDRQTVCLVEKLCHRFRTTLNERQWRDLAYCLNLLNYSERSVAKLYENMICFADKLTSDSVHESITSIITASRKIPGIKPETKQMLDEFEQKVNECRSKGIDGNEDESELLKVVGTPTAPSRRQSIRASTTTKAPKSTQRRKAPKARAKKSARVEEDYEDDDDDFVAPSKPAPREVRSRREAKKRIVQLFDDSEEESDG